MLFRSHTFIAEPCYLAKAQKNVGAPRMEADTPPRGGVCVVRSMSGQPEKAPKIFSY